MTTRSGRGFHGPMLPYTPKKRLTKKEKKVDYLNSYLTIMDSPVKINKDDYTETELDRLINDYERDFKYDIHNAASSKIGQYHRNRKFRDTVGRTVQQRIETKRRIKAEQEKETDDYFAGLGKKQQKIDKLRAQLFANRVVPYKLDENGIPIEDEPYVEELNHSRVNTSIGANMMGCSRRLPAGEWTQEELKAYMIPERRKHKMVRQGNSVRY
jgi:soluble cytochrome b562